MSIYTIKQSRIIALILILLLGAFLLYSLKDLISAILGAIVIYVLFKPMYLFFINRARFNRALSAVLIMLVSFIIIIIPFLSLSIMMVNKVVFYTDHPELVRSIIKSIEDFAGHQLKQPRIIEDSINNLGKWVVSIFPEFFSTTLGILLTISMMYFFLYFMLTKFEIFESTLIRYIPFRARNADHFGIELRNITFSNVIGQGIVSFAQGFLLAIGFWIFKIEDPVFWGLVAFFMAFLPVVGTPIVFVPAGIIELANGRTFSGIGILIWGFVLVTNIDNVMRLYINKKVGDIHPLITITGVVIGIPLFGILGIVFGPLLISIFVLLVRMFEAAFLNDAEPEKEKVISKEELKS